MALFDRFGFSFDNMRVLLVEDNEFELNLGKVALNQLGFKTVVVARDGEEAYKTIEMFPTINLVISDWNMPNLNGLEFLKIVRQQWPGMPFVMMTSNDRLEKVAEAKKAGVYAYVLKPFTMEQLQEKIIAAIRHRLALGGDFSDESDQIYIQAIEHVETVARHFNQGDAGNIPPEMEKLEKAVEAILFPDHANDASIDDIREVATALCKQVDIDADRLELIELIVAQLGDFIDKLDIPNPVQLEVVKLHVEAIYAVSTRGAGGLEKIDGEQVIAGLNVAVSKSLIGP